MLYKLFPTPVVALNRAVIIAELHGPAAAIDAIEKIENSHLLKKYYLLPATLGELYFQLKQNDKALAYFKDALALTQSAAEKKLLQQKIDRMQHH